MIWLIYMRMYWYTKNILELKDLVVGYTDHIKMGQNRYILTCIRYYDNYAFTEFSSDWSFANMASSASAKGLLTGVFEAV